MVVLTPHLFLIPALPHLLLPAYEVGQCNNIKAAGSQNLWHTHVRGIWLDMQPGNPVPFRTFRILAPAAARSPPESCRELPPVSTRWEQYGEGTWRTMYPYIRRLYLDENRRLDEVMKHLETNFDFKPTYATSPPSVPGLIRASVQAYMQYL